MNFLISPEGELQMNSKMDEAGKVIAGKFVDELVKLGVLLPAAGELRANCPLFCVDKASQPGEKRCMQIAKRADKISRAPALVAISESQDFLFKMISVTPVLVVYPTTRAVFVLDHRSQLALPIRRVSSCPTIFPCLISYVKLVKSELS